MKDGIYFDLPSEEYHAVKALSSSGVRDILENPTYYWFNFFNPLKEDITSDAMRDGSIFHSLILEPEKFNQLYKVMPLEIEQLNKNSTEFKLWRSAQGLEVIGRKKYQKFKTIIEYLKQPNQLLDNDFLKTGYSEVSIFWTENGVQKKARIDKLQAGRIVDLKTFIKKTKGDINKFVSQYFFSYKVYLQLIYYKRAIEFAVKNGLPVFGTAEQKEFVKSLENVNFMLSAVFVNREIPQAVVKLFLQEKCGDLWRLGEKQIEKAEKIYCQYMTEFGIKSAWLQNIDTANLMFTDNDFPRSFYEILDGGANE